MKDNFTKLKLWSSSDTAFEPHPNDYNRFYDACEEAIVNSTNIETFRHILKENLNQRYKNDQEDERTSKYIGKFEIIRDYCLDQNIY